MRDLQGFKISNPKERFDRISLLINKLQDNIELKKWGISVRTNFTQLKGKKLYPPKVMTDERGGVSDWMSYEKGDIRHSQPI
jgi:hypothetical protein